MMAWCRTGDKPLSEPMLTQCTDIYICRIGGNYHRFLDKHSDHCTANVSIFIELLWQHNDTHVEDALHHYSEVIMSMMVSQITGVSSVYSTVCSGADENIKALRHCPLWGEFTGDRWIPRAKGQHLMMILTMSRMPLILAICYPIYHE